MLKVFKYRLCPTASQAEKIDQNLGCARFVYNIMLDAKIKHYEQHKETLYITPARFNMTRAGIPRALARGRNASNQIISQKHLTFPKTRV